MTAFDPKTDKLVEAATNRYRAGQHLTSLLGIFAVCNWVPEAEVAFHENRITREFLALADTLGFVAMPKADHLVMTGFIEDLRDHKPTVISGRHMGNVDPQDDVDDMMPLDEFEAFQADANAMIPRPKKPKPTIAPDLHDAMQGALPDAHAAPSGDICGENGEIRAYPNAGWTKPSLYCAGCFAGRDGENSFTDFPLAGAAA